MMFSLKQTFLWAIAAKGIQSSLLYTSPTNAAAEETLALLVYDCDGTEVNRAEITFPASGNCIFELEYLTGLMKLESGMRHGLIALESQSGGRLLVRYQTPQTVALVPIQQPVSNIKQGLIPVHCSENRRTLVALCNCEDTPVQVRGRFVIGKRSPEITWTLDPISSRLVEINSSFAAAIGEDDLTFSGRGYLRLSTGAIRGVLAHSLVVDQRNPESELVEIFQG